MKKCKTSFTSEQISRSIQLGFSTEIMKMTSVFLLRHELLIFVSMVLAKASYCLVLIDLDLMRQDSKIWCPSR